VAQGKSRQFAATAKARWFKAHRNIDQIVLGVGKDNAAAIRAYEKVGFVETCSEFIRHVSSDAMTMAWDLTNDVLGLEVDPQLSVQKADRRK